MARRFIPWGDDAHGLVCDFLPWYSNAKLACCGMVFRDALISYVDTNDQVWWGQGQSTSSDVETLVYSLKTFRKELSPSCRPNMAMFMIDSQVLWTTTARDLCTRLHSANLVPLECPIVLVESDSGVCGAGVSGEWNFTVYQDRDVELDPAPPVTAVLIVAYIPPEPQAETRDTNGGTAKPRVNCFLVNDHPHNRRHRFSMSVDASDSVLMECVPPPLTPRAFRIGTSGSHAGARAATIPSRRAPSTRPSQRRLDLASAVAEDGFGASLDPAHKGHKGIKSGHKGTALEGARGHRSAEASPEAGEGSVRARAEASLRTRIELLPPSTSVPLEGADTILLVGSHPNLLEKTSESLKRLLPRAVVLGGVSGCSLVIADRVFPSGLNRQTQSRGQTPKLVGIALRGVHAMALSSKGFEGLGPVFRVQTSARSEQEAPQAQPGKFLRDVMVVAEAGGVATSRPSTAVDILHSQILQDFGWAANDYREVYLGVSSSIDELLNLRNTPGTCEDRGESTGEAHGIPPISVVSDRGHALGLDKEVSPGQYARFMHSTPALSLVDTTTTYRYCKQRLGRLGGDVLGSIRFACSLRAEHVELSNEQRLQQRQRAQDGEESENFVTLLNQQVRADRSLGVTPLPRSLRPVVTCAHADIHPRCRLLSRCLSTPFVMLFLTAHRKLCNFVKSWMLHRRGYFATVSSDLCRGWCAAFFQEPLRFACRVLPLARPCFAGAPTSSCDRVSPAVCTSVVGSGIKSILYRFCEIVSYFKTYLRSTRKEINVPLGKPQRENIIAVGLLKELLGDRNMDIAFRRIFEGAGDLLFFALP